jgi:hypothetical protein
MGILPATGCSVTEPGIQSALTRASPGISQTLGEPVDFESTQEAALRSQIDATNELIRINTDMLEILRGQYANGYASELNVAAQESQLAHIAATLPPLLKELAQRSVPTRRKRENTLVKIKFLSMSSSNDEYLTPHIQ